MPAAMMPSVAIADCESVFRLSSFVLRLATLPFAICSLFNPRSAIHRARLLQPRDHVAVLRHGDDRAGLGELVDVADQHGLAFGPGAAARRAARSTEKELALAVTRRTKTGEPIASERSKAVAGQVVGVLHA